MPLLPTQKRHHAYIWQTNLSNSDTLIQELRDEQNTVYKYHYGRLAIDNVRSLKQKLSIKINRDQHLWHIITTYRITNEASNALLKSAEDTTKNHHIVIITEETNLLDTILSRFQVIESSEASDDWQEEINELLNKTTPKRLDHINNIVKNWPPEKIETFIQYIIKHGYNNDSKKEFFYEIEKLSKTPINKKPLLELLAIYQKQ